MGFRHVEDEQVGIAVPVQLFLDVDHDAQLVGLAQRRQELALHLVHVQHADDLHLLAALAHAEDQMPTLGVGECGDRLVGVAGHAASGFLELDVSPFVPAKQFDQLVLRHAVARCSALAGGPETPGSILRRRQSGPVPPEARSVRADRQVTGRPGANQDDMYAANRIPPCAGTCADPVAVRIAPVTRSRSAPAPRPAPSPFRRRSRRSAASTRRGSPEIRRGRAHGAGRRR